MQVSPKIANKAGVDYYYEESCQHIVRFTYKQTNHEPQDMRGLHNVMYKK